MNARLRLGVGLFKDECGHSFDIYLEMAAYQVNSYREIWDEEQLFVTSNKLNWG